jgi:mannosylglucosylglycerate synthase
VKIALVHYSCLPVLGGVEIVMAAHARLFADHGHAVTLVCGRGGSGDPRINTVPLPDGDDVQKLAGELRSILAAQDVVMIHNVMTMHFRLPLTEALWNLAGELTGVRFVGWVHDLAACNPDYALPPLARSHLSRAHERIAYVAVSEHRRGQFAELTGAPARIVPNGIDASQALGLGAPVVDFSRRFHLFEREVVLLHPTRLLRRKNVELGIRVAAELHASGVSCAYLVTAARDAQNAASADYARELRALRTELAMEPHVHFLHEHFAVTAGDLADLHRIADALFLPSRQEGFGLPVLEAALHRLPIFCSDIEPLASLTAGRAHTFSLDATPAEIAARIAVILRADPRHCAKRETLATHAWEEIYPNCLAPLLIDLENSNRL